MIALSFSQNQHESFYLFENPTNHLFFLPLKYSKIKPILISKHFITFFSSKFPFAIVATFAAIVLGFFFFFF
jgi:hypothetical protein